MESTPAGSGAAPRGLSRRVQGDVALQLLARLFSASVAFVLTAVLLARRLPEDAFGFFNFYLTVFLLAMTLVDFGVNRAAIRAVASGDAALAPTLRAAIALKTWVGTAGFLVVAAGVLIAEKGVATRLLLVVAAAHMISHGLAGASIGFEANVRFRVPALSVIVGYGVFLVSGLALLAAGTQDAAPYLVAFGAGITSQNVFLHWRARRVFEIAPTLDRAVLRKLVFEALPLGFSAAAVAIYFYTDTILLRPLRGAEDVARYSVAYRLMTFGLMAPVLFSQVLFPVFARCHGVSRAVLKKAVERSTFYLALAGACGAATLFALAPQLLELVYGASYRDAAPVLRILSVAMFLVYLAYPHTTALIAAGHAMTFTRITVCGAVLNVALNLLLLGRFGPEGAASTTLATEAMVLISGAAFARQHTGAHGFSRLLLGPFALAGTIAFVLLVPLADRPLWMTVPTALMLTALATLWVRAFPFRLGVDDALSEPRA